MTTIFLIFSVDRIYRNTRLGIPLYHNKNSNFRPLLLISPLSLPAPVHFFFVSTVLDLQTAAQAAPSNKARPVNFPHSDGVSVTSRRLLCLPHVSVTGKQRLLHLRYTACHNTRVREVAYIHGDTPNIDVFSVQLVRIIMFPRLVAHHNSMQILFIS